MKGLLKSINYWLGLLLITDLFFVFLVWLIGYEVFGNIVIIILLFTIFIFITGYLIELRKRGKQKSALQLFLDEPSDKSKKALQLVTNKYWHPIIQSLFLLMKGQSEAINNKQLESQNYRDFIEAWTHEIKTPLSLATLVINNHKDEMSPYVYSRMEHVRHLINNDVERILYYARLQADHMDYKFEKIDLSSCVQDAIDDFTTIINEKKIKLQMQLLPLQVVSDKKMLGFMLSQLLSNAFKYTATIDGIVNVIIWQDDNQESQIHLAIRDNGKGVPPEDAPFIFDKCFTGNHPDRQNASGIGLYLVKKYAEVLSLDVRLELISTSGEGFGVELIFPHVY